MGYIYGEESSVRTRREHFPWSLRPTSRLRRCCTCETRRCVCGRARPQKGESHICSHQHPKRTHLGREPRTSVPTRRRKIDGRRKCVLRDGHGGIGVSLRRSRHVAHFICKLWKDKKRLGGVVSKVERAPSRGVHVGAIPITWTPLTASAACRCPKADI